MFITNMLNRGKWGLKINSFAIVKCYCEMRDVLTKCDRTEGTITIPDHVRAVARNAFEGCENVRIDRSPNYIEAKLTHCIARGLDYTVHQNDDWTQPYQEFKEYGPCLGVWGMEADRISASIKKAIGENTEDNKDISWRIVEMDADDILKVCDRMKAIGDENLVKINGDSIETFKGLPLLMRSATRQFGSSADIVNEIIEKEGFGVLYIKNITKENNETFPDNFIYNLTKNHAFNFVHLSPKWIVIMQIGPNVRLDAPGGMRMSFSGNNYRGMTPEEYIKDMERRKCVVDVEENRDLNKFVISAEEMAHLLKRRKEKEEKSRD